MIDIKSVVLPPENEIIDRWNSEDVVVSVVCTTFNHEQYIENAIIGFLMQVTDFAFEIIIHDDASADGTAGIIKKYQELYPNIIKPIFQEENQYSKGGFKPIPYASKFARGKYIALCEGDDYWCAHNKLQCQKDALQASDNDICFTSGFYLINDQLSSVHEYFNKRTIVSLEDVVIRGGGYMITASLFIRAEILHNLPDWFYENAPVGDVFIEIFGSLRSGALFLPEKTVVYRQFVTDSWSSNQFNIPCHVELKRLSDFQLCFEYLNKDFGVDKDSIQEALSREYFLSSLKFVVRDFLFSRFLLLKSLKISNRKYLLRYLYYFSFNEFLAEKLEWVLNLYRDMKKYIRKA